MKIVIAFFTAIRGATTSRLEACQMPGRENVSGDWNIVWDQVMNSPLICVQEFELYVLNSGQRF